MRRGRGAVAGTVLGGLLAAGCLGGAPEPSRLAAESKPTATRSRAASPVAGGSEQAPVAFVRRYIEAMNDAQTSGDTTEIAELSDADCFSCNGTIKVFRRIHDRGGSFAGDPSLKVVEAGLRPGGTDPVVVSVYLRNAPYELVARRGAKPEPRKGQTLLYDFTVEGQGERWKVKDFTVQG